MTRIIATALAFLFLWSIPAQAQTTVEGCTTAPTSTQSWGAGFTFGDIRSGMEIPSGATVTHVGVHSPVAGATVRPKIVQHVSGSTYDTVQNEASFAHSGTGVDTVALSTAFTAPSAGYYVFWYIQGTASEGPTGSRASKAGDVTGSASYTTGSYPLPCISFVIDGTVDPDPEPDPEPTPTAGDCQFIMTGQSNGNYVAANHGSLLTSTFDAILGRNTSALANAAVGGSSIEEWKPGSSYLNNAISAFNSGVASGRVPCAMIYYQGEYESNFNADVAKSTLSVDTLRWDERLKAIVSAFRSGVNAPNLPVVVVVLHANHETGRPYWDRIQLHQRNVTDPSHPHYIPNSVNVDLSDLDGTTDGVHLTSALQAIAARRMAATLAATWFVTP